MAKITIIINKTEYPCYFTLGAALVFKQETGKDASRIDKTDLVEVGTLLYAQCKAAARREKLDFPYSLEEFLCYITDKDLESWSQGQGKDSKKK